MLFQPNYMRIPIPFPILFFSEAFPNNMSLPPPLSLFLSLSAFERNLRTYFYWQLAAFLGDQREKKNSHKLSWRLRQLLTKRMKRGKRNEERMGWEGKHAAHIVTFDGRHAYRWQTWHTYSHSPASISRRLSSRETLGNTEAHTEHHGVHVGNRGRGPRDPQYISRLLARAMASNAMSRIENQVGNSLVQILLSHTFSLIILYREA